MSGGATSAPGTHDCAPRLLSAGRDDRESAPSDVWDFIRYATWRSDIWKLIEDFAGPAVQAAFKENPPPYVSASNFRWLNDLTHKVLGVKVDSCSTLANRLAARYRAIRAVHGTLTSSVLLFYREGLRPLVLEDAHQKAREIFLSGAFPELSEARLLNAISRVTVAGRPDRVYFECNERFLLQHCHHYLEYGGEYLAGIADELGGNGAYKEHLRSQGKATIFVCDVPLGFFTDDLLEGFAGLALEAVFRELLEGPGYKFRCEAGAPFSIAARLQPSHIVGHSHPF